MPVGFAWQDNIEPQHRAFFNAYDVRRSYYRSVLAGATGFTYGCESIRQIYRPGDLSHAWDGKGIPTWQEGLSAPGSSQLKLLKDVLLERSYFTRIPAQDILLESAGNTPLAHTVAARCQEGSYSLIYTPMRQMLSINTSAIASQQLRVSIYDPEACKCIRGWTCENSGQLRYIPARQLDTLIVIDALTEN